ncbi:Polypyrimidine tract-binding protein-like protein 2 [Hibiscus syriacus]|uniref:Polypyrimidine tract-binding protein-like protein 2 n=1 Tax=Hibiscus syriacus TaxID=106335 RepID=A0A6A3D4K7_HIBSY|nr:Polypyrimidine tract-binding protein-like protein 2 [Hibiscus syriacus]
MASLSSQLQFRYTQPPSKVLHLRNLPWESDIAGNILLVTIEGQDARLVSIDVLHLDHVKGIISNGSLVHPEKEYIFLIKKQQRLQKMPWMDESSLDLSVKFQSHRSREYTNPYLPVAPSAIDRSSQFNLGLDGKRLEPESNVLLSSIENMQYAVTLDVVFSAFGTVKKIAMFDKNAALQALIQSRDYTITNPAVVNPQPSGLGQRPIQTMGQAGHQFNGTQYAALGMGQPVMRPQPSAGWRTSAIPAVSQSMPVQITNHNPYILPSLMPQMSPGMMQMPGHIGLPAPASSMPPFRPNHM